MTLEDTTTQSLPLPVPAPDAEIVSSPLDEFDSEAPEQPKAPSRTKAKVIAAVVAGALILGAGGGVLFVQKQRAAEAVAAARAELSGELSEADALRLRGAASITAATDAMLTSGDRVADESVRTELDVARASLRESQPATLAALPLAAGLDEVEAVAAKALAANLSYAALIDAVDAQTKVVNDAVASWELAQAITTYDQAGTDLQGAIDAATAVQTGSEGKVTDNAVRQSLADALVAAQGAQVAADLNDLAAVTAAITVRTDARTALDAANTAVAQAQGVWQAEQDAAAAAAVAETNRLAAEKAAAEKLAKNNKGSTVVTKTDPATGKKTVVVENPSGGTVTPPAAGGSTGGSTGGGTTTPPPPVATMDAGTEIGKLLAARSAAGKTNVGADATCSELGGVKSSLGAAGILRSAAHSGIVMGPTWGRITGYVDGDIFYATVYSCLKQG